MLPPQPASPVSNEYHVKQRSGRSGRRSFDHGVAREGGVAIGSPAIGRLSALKGRGRVAEWLKALANG
jgi:hypothetical protein